MRAQPALLLLFLGCALGGAQREDASGGAPLGTTGHRRAPKHCWQPPPHGSSRYVPGQVLVRFKRTPSGVRAAAAQAKRAALASLRLHRLVGRNHALLLPHHPAGAGEAAVGRQLAQAGQEAPSLPSDALMLFDIIDGSTVEDIVARLCQHPDVDLVEPNFLAQHHALRPAEMRRGLVEMGGGTANPAAIPSDPLFFPTLSGGLSSLWHLEKIQAPAAWAFSTGKKTVKVCAIDSGILTGHEDLAANVAGGWNRMARGANGQGMPLAGTADYLNITDFTGHGTAVAGIIGAVGNNGVGTVGVNWQVSLYMCKVGDSAGNWPMTSIIDCYDLCRRAGVRVVSASFSALDNSVGAQEAVAELRDAGILLVAAAGNSAANSDVSPRYPAALSGSASFRNVIGVAASTPSDTLLSISNYGKSSVTLAAPGVYLRTTNCSAPNAYWLFSGTSAATPVVAGAVALMYAADTTGAGFLQIRAALEAGVDASAGLANRVKTGGRLNLARSITKLLGKPDPAPYRSPCCVVAQDTWFDLAITTEARWAIESTAWPALFDATLGQDCSKRCASYDWCEYFVSTADTFSQLNIRMECTTPGCLPFCPSGVCEGNCLMVDAAASLRSSQPSAQINSGYRGLQAPPPKPPAPRPPRPPPPKPRPPPARKPPPPRPKPRPPPPRPKPRPPPPRPKSRPPPPRPKPRPPPPRQKPRPPPPRPKPRPPPPRRKPRPPPPRPRPRPRPPPPRPRPPRPRPR